MQPAGCDCSSKVRYRGVGDCGHGDGGGPPSIQHGHSKALPYGAVRLLAGEAGDDGCEIVQVRLVDYIIGNIPALTTRG